MIFNGVFKEGCEFKIVPKTTTVVVDTVRTTTPVAIPKDRVKPTFTEEQKYKIPNVDFYALTVIWKNTKG